MKAKRDFAGLTAESLRLRRRSARQIAKRMTTGCLPDLSRQTAFFTIAQLLPKEPSPVVRVALVHALSRSTDPNAVPCLLKCLAFDLSEKVRTAACQALLGCNREQVSRELGKMFVGIPDKCFSNVELAALRLLEDGIRLQPETIRELRQLAVLETKALCYRGAIVSLLIRSEDPVAHECVAALLRDRSDDPRFVLKVIELIHQNAIADPVIFGTSDPCDTMSVVRHYPILGAALKELSMQSSTVPGILAELTYSVLQRGVGPSPEYLREGAERMAGSSA